MTRRRGERRLVSDFKGKNQAQNFVILETLLHWLLYIPGWQRLYLELDTIGKLIFQFHKKIIYLS